MERKPQIFFAEPFRIFFPLGLLLGAIGVSLWPLYYWHVLTIYPAVLHMRLMIEGLMGSFVLGFLGTAGPRLLDAAPFHANETLPLFALQLASAALHLAHKQTAADALFLALFLFFVFALIRRRSASSDAPPPSFVFVAGGFVNVCAGLLLLLLAGHSLFADQLGWLLLE